MLKSQEEKIRLVNGNVMIVGIDVAKKKHLARFFDSKGLEISKRLSFRNDQAGILKLVGRIMDLEQQHGLENTIVGMEATGHYYEPLAYFLKRYPMVTVLVNPYHVKKSKEMDDNSPDKNDIKDALLVAKLIREGRFFQMYLPEGVYRELRNLSSEYRQQRKKLNSAKNRLAVILDKHFPEYTTVFKDKLAKTSLYILKHHPFPAELCELSLEKLTDIIKTASNKRLGEQKAAELINVARISIGLQEGLDSARYRLRSCLAEIEFHQGQIEETKKQMAECLKQTGFMKSILSIPGVGVVTAARFLGEVGDISRFEHPSQIVKLAGFNLKGNTSGKKVKSQTSITKRGRSELRCLLYQAVLVAVAKNPQIKELYNYFKTRPVNPLKPKQAMIAVCNKLIRIMYALATQNALYDPEKVLGQFRELQLKEAA